MKFFTAFIAVCFVAAACGQNSPLATNIAEADSTPSSDPAPASYTQEPGNPHNIDLTEAPSTTTPYPFIFLHGMAGFIELGPLEYWADIINTLNAQGHDAYPVEVEPFATMAVRAENAALQIDEILNATGAQKVHLLGHSQGGLDGRYIISSLGYQDRIASLTTIASPHRGVQTIDAALGLLPDFSEEAIAAIFDVLASAITDTDADLLAQLKDMSVEHMQNTFNPNNPDASQVAYYSMGGVTQASLNVDTNTTDIVNPLFLATFALETILEGDNDGLVPVSSAKWGTYLGTAPADHLDEIGMFPGDPSRAFDYILFYTQLADFLSNNGPPPLLP